MGSWRSGLVAAIGYPTGPARHFPGNAAPTSGDQKPGTLRQRLLLQWGVVSKWRPYPAPVEVQGGVKGQAARGKGHACKADEGRGKGQPERERGNDRGQVGWPRAIRNFLGFPDGRGQFSWGGMVSIAAEFPDQYSPVYDPNRQEAVTGTVHEWGLIECPQYYGPKYCCARCGRRNWGWSLWREDTLPTCPGKSEG